MPPEPARPALEQVALARLYEGVVARFQADGRAAVRQPFGWREPARQKDTVERIVWVPGDSESGDIGKLEAPKYPGGNPRPLATLGELFTCFISGADPNDPASEFKQWKATRLLFDEWLRAVRHTAPGLFTIVRSTWIKEQNTHRYGAAMRVLGAIQSTIPDYTQASVPTGAKAEITVVELDRTDPTFIAP